MASKPSWQYYQSLGKISRIRALAESVFNNRNNGGGARIISAAEAYDVACEQGHVGITDLPMDPNTIQRMGLPADAKVINDNHGETVGRSAEARIFYNDTQGAERNALEGLCREALYELQTYHDLIIVEAVVGTHPDMMIKARLICPEEDAFNAFTWLANFNPLAACPEYRDSKLLDMPDILFVAYPEWKSDDPRWSRGCVVVDEQNMTIFNFGLRYFGERKKGTLTMAWTAGMKLGAVAAHGGIKEIDLTGTKDFSERGKQVIAFYGLSGSGKSSHSNSLDNEGTLPEGFTRKIAHDDAFQIDYTNKQCYVWEPSLFDKTDSRDIDHPDWEYLICTQNMMLADYDGKIVPYGQDSRNNNGRAIFAREMLGDVTDTIGFPNSIGWLTKDITLPPLVKVKDNSLAVCMGATLMTKRTAAENVTEEEMKKLVFVPFANPFRVYPLYEDCIGYGHVFDSGCDCYSWNGGGFGFWKSSEDDVHPVPLDMSLALQTAILCDTMEWEDWDLVPGMQLPARESVEKIWPGYYDTYNPANVENKEEYLALLKDRFQQRIDFLKSSDVAGKADLLAKLVGSIKMAD